MDAGARRRVVLAWDGGTGLCAMMYLNVLGLWEREGRGDWGLGINAEVEGGRMGVGGGGGFFSVFNGWRGICGRPRRIVNWRL